MLDVDVFFLSIGLLPELVVDHSMNQFMGWSATSRFLTEAFLQ